MSNAVNLPNNPKNRDVDKIFTRKVDLDYIPGLDDELKIILPGNLKSFKKNQLKYLI